MMALFDVQVYACMVHNLFDEYRYFPKYPDKVSLRRKNI